MQLFDVKQYNRIKPIIRQNSLTVISKIQQLCSNASIQSYPNPLQVNLPPLMHYLCDAIVRIIFDDAPDPQVLSLEVIGELGGSVVHSG
ncbi:MAG: hypothetical protein EZS28_001575 [Streblomastix strix]|uniref:Uncharacterized protein n=1 Tax=Streblomastix strix TaxID=222440 RepID=A0A5J4X789_9EUKA|nr:MAG: hypothetical protein EZS28_001575 [Streblomastix strix]